MLNLICYVTVLFNTHQFGENLVRGKILEKSKLYYVVDFSKDSRRLGIIEIGNTTDLKHVRIRSQLCEETRGH